MFRFKRGTSDLMRSTLLICGALAVIALLVFIWGRATGIAVVKPRLVAATAQAEAAQKGIEAERASGRRMSVQARTAEQAASVAADVATDLSQTETAHAPLAADRRDRLRRADQRLCQLAPNLGGCRTAD